MASVVVASWAVVVLLLAIFGLVTLILVRFGALDTRIANERMNTHFMLEAVARDIKRELLKPCVIQRQETGDQNEQI